MSELVTNIGLLVTADGEPGDPLGLHERAAVVMDRGEVAWIGAATDAPAADWMTDAEGGCVIPGFVDSHSHLVFAGDRATEFSARMRGESYTAGGIRTTVAATRAATDDELEAGVRRLVDEALASGTTTMEIKSGYGLTVEDEVRALRIAGRFTSETTFLGAHVVPAEYAERRADYVDLVAGEMLEAVRPHARWIDVFCERGAFDLGETRRILEAGRDAGLGLRVHANQLSRLGAIELAVELGAASVDHCTHLGDDEIDLLRDSSTMATFVPAAEFATRQPYPDVERLRRAGVDFAIATDCNPGSSYTTSMAFCIALAVRDMRATPEEALLASTVHGATALRRDDIGRIAVGARADLVLLRSPSYLHLAYRPGVDLVATVWKDGVAATRHCGDGRSASGGTAHQ